MAACLSGDLASVRTVVEDDGASVDEVGTAPGGDAAVVPLHAAVTSQNIDLVTWLLSRGASPNGDGVMRVGAGSRNPAIFQLLIDAGGSVNRASEGIPPLFEALRESNKGCLKVLLRDPWTALWCKYNTRTAVETARVIHRRNDLAKLIQDEVRGFCQVTSACLSVAAVSCLGALLYTPQVVSCWLPCWLCVVGERSVW